MIVRRQANSVDDCTIDDCMIDDGCITEESYNAGLFDSCYGELINWILCQLYWCHFNIYLSMLTVETLQVGFSQSTVAVDENAGIVTLTIELNQNAWVTQPVTVTYSTSSVSNAVDAASMFVKCSL